MKVKEMLEESPTMILLAKGTDFNKLETAIPKQLSGEKVIYVSMNKTYSALKEKFKKAKINTKYFFFIDGITKTITNVRDNEPDCKYVSSPASFTEISITLSELLKKGFEYVIFDSLTNLLIYQKTGPVSKFLSSTVARIRSNDAKGIFYALSIREQEPLIQQASMFVDNVVSAKI